MKKNTPDFIMAAIVGLAAAVRLYGLAWGLPYHFHPDENTVMLVVNYLGQSWNPHCSIYGSLPMYLIACLEKVTLLGVNRADSVVPMSLIYLTGRLLAAMAGIWTTYVIGSLARGLAGRDAGRIAALLWACNVLSIQQSHFTVVDSMLCALMMMALRVQAAYWEEGGRRQLAKSAVLLAAALATKPTAALLAPCLVIALAGRALGSRADSRSVSWPATVRRFTLAGLATLAITLAALFIFSPYLFLDFAGNVLNPQFGGTWEWNSQMASGALFLRWTNYFEGTLPYLYHLTNLLPWSMGWPVFLLGLAGLPRLAALALSRERAGRAASCLLLVFFLAYYAVVGSWYVKYVRYMLPLVPVLCIAAGLAIVYVRQHARRLPALLLLAVAVVSALSYAVSYLAIYRVPDTRLQARAWIMKHIEPGAAVMIEVEYDVYTPPIGQSGWLMPPVNPPPYSFKILEPISLQVLETNLTVGEALAATDWVVISNRHFPTYVDRPRRYPQEAAFYNRLFSGEAGFELAKKISRHPGFLGISLDDAKAELTFNIFDHPEIYIFKKKQPDPTN